MDVLLFTSDPNALRDNSPLQARLKEYGAVGRHFVVIVLNSRFQRAAPRKIGGNVWIIPTNSWVPLFAPLQALAIARRELFFQGKLQVDVVDGRDVSLAGLAAWLVARKFRRPLHLHVQQDIFSKFYAGGSFGNFLRAQLARALIPRADAVSTDSESIRAAIADMPRDAGERAFLTTRFIDVAAVRSDEMRTNLAAKYPTFKFILLFVAPLQAAFNPHLAVAVLASVLERYPHAGLVIVGEGSLKRRLRFYARSRGLAGRVAFERWHNDRYSYYKSAHVFLVTAQYEEYGDTIAEAAAAGCAIVSTPVGLASAIIKDGESGFLCDPADPSRFSAVILSMINDPSIRERVRLNGMLAIEQYMARSDASTRIAEVRKIWEAAARNFSGS